MKLLEKCSRKMDRKGQLEMGITMMVLLVFFVLLIIALIVYLKFSYLTIKETKQEILDEKFSTLVNAVTGLPELQCSLGNNRRECLDVKKLIAFRDALSANQDNIRDRYYEDFGINGLDVEIVYPVLQQGQCNRGFYDEGCDNFELFKIKEEGLKYTTPVSVYYPIENKHVIGKLVITADVK